MKYGGSTINDDAIEEISDNSVSRVTTSKLPTLARARANGGRQDKVKKQHKKSSDRHSGTTLPYTIQLKGDIKVS